MLYLKGNPQNNNAMLTENEIENTLFTSLRKTRSKLTWINETNVKLC